MSLFEHYGMGIPIFAPSLDFLTYLHMKDFLVIERTHIWNRRKGSKLPYSPDYRGSARVLISKAGTKNAGQYYVGLDPNNDYDTFAVNHWLSLADYYTLPHIVHFTCIEHLVDILQQMWTEPSRLQAIHAEMVSTNRLRLKSILRFWRRRLMDIAMHSPHKPI